MAAPFNATKHPRSAGGRFGESDSPAAPKLTKGAAYLKAANVGGADTIKVLSSRVRKYAGHASVESYVGGHANGRAYALRVLAADHAAGRIAFAEAGKPQVATRKTVSKAPPSKSGVGDPQSDHEVLGGTATVAVRNRGVTQIVYGSKAQLTDRIEGRTTKARALFENKTAGEFIAEHPRGSDAARKALGDAAARGHVLFHRTVTPDTSTLSEVTSGLKPDDYLVGDPKKYAPGGTLSDYVNEHQGGHDAGRRQVANDIAAGRVKAMRPTAEIPKPIGAAAAADIAFGAQTSPAFRATVSEGWERVPEKLRDKIKAFGITVHAPHRLIDTAPDIADEHPRGWSQGSTWKNVDGCYRGGTVRQLVTAETAMDRRYGRWRAFSAERSLGVQLHETGHAVDHALGFPSERGSFRQAYGRDVAKFLNEGGKLDDGQYRYYLQPGNAGSSEMFAEMFADRMGQPSAFKSPPLHERFPECARWIDAMIRDHR